MSTHRSPHALHSCIAASSFPPSILCATNGAIFVLAESKEVLRHAGLFLARRSLNRPCIEIFQSSGFRVVLFRRQLAGSLERNYHSFAQILLGKCLLSFSNKTVYTFVKFLHESSEVVSLQAHRFPCKCQFILTVGYSVLQPALPF